MLNDANLRALELVPLIRVIAGETGQDACYFYNRVEGAEVRWVSHHFHADPELLLPDEDGCWSSKCWSSVPPQSGSSRAPRKYTACLC